LCNTNYAGKYVVENGDSDNPILTPMLFKEGILNNVEFLDYIAIQSSIRTKKSIRSITGNVIKMSDEHELRESF
jgi:hypothetical protein